MTFLVLFLGAIPAFAGDGNDIEIEISTDRTAYFSGSLVRLLVTKCNPTASPILVTQSCPCCDFSLEMATPSGQIVAQAAPTCPPVLVFITWQPGQCIDESFVWLQLTGDFDLDGSSDGDPVPPGSYIASYTWFPQSVSTQASTSFEILASEIPTTSVVGTLLLSLALVSFALLRLRYRR